VKKHTKTEASRSYISVIYILTATAVTVPRSGEMNSTQNLRLDSVLE
jgi:hypothetical protein